MIDFLVNDLMMPLLKYFHVLTGSYGWAIVFLTLAVKTALMPLTFQSLKASIEMQKLQPKLKELQNKYKDRPEVYNKKVMELYRDSKVNPLGGCLPILFQMPFFIGLYSTFISDEFKKLIAGGHDASFLFINDLTRVGLSSAAGLHLDNLILILLFGVTTFVSQKMMITNPDDPMQKQMLYLMPPMITFMFVLIPVPSGAMLYIVVSNLYTIAQNIVVLNKKKSMELSSKDSAKPESNSTINLSKEKESEDEELSPVLASVGKSKRVKKKKKRNRKK